jgi:hypothetical protein
MKQAKANIGASTDLRDWKSIEDDREKYAAYLCSREWAILKEAVHKRAYETCERCSLFPIDAVHHLSYERKYHEDLTDLQGICKRCHDFTHNKGGMDLLTFPWRMRRYFHFCVSLKLTAPPTEWWLVSLSRRAEILDHAVHMLASLSSLCPDADLELSNAADAIGRDLGFDLRLLHHWYEPSWHIPDYDRLRAECGFQQIPSEGFELADEE